MYINDHNPLSWIRGIDKGNVSIGEGSWIGPFTIIDGEYDKVELGKGVNVAPGVQILTHDTVQRCITNKEYNQIDHKPTKVGNYVFIGPNAIISKGCIVGDSSVIGANAVLLDDTIVPPNSFVYGTPAKIRPLKKK